MSASANTFAAFKAAKAEEEREADEAKGWTYDQQGYPAQDSLQPVGAFEPLERPGTMRASQQVGMKIEYSGGMQIKHVQEKSYEELARLGRAGRAAEVRQDLSMGLPADYIRHWREGDSEDRMQLLATQTQRHCQAGICCLPSCLVWLCSLKVGSRQMSKWQKQEAEAAKMSKLQKQ